MDFISTLINGLSLGGIYAMIALGYTMVYGIAKMLNFAHGDIIMVGGYVIYVFLMMIGQPIAALVVAVVFCALFGILVERLAYRPLRGASPLAVLITAIGVSYLLQSLGQIIFGSNSKYVNIADFGTWSLGKITISIGSVITLASCVVVMLALHLFVKYSRIGRAMVAVSEDRGAASLMGINVNGIIAITFAIGSALAALAAFFYLLDKQLQPTLGALPGIKAFTAAVIGGIGSIPGAMLGGVLLGIVECFSNAVPVLAPYTDAIEFSLLIVILLVKPTGFLGKIRKEKV